MNSGPLSEIFGSRAAEAVLLHLYHYGETYGRQASRDMNVSLLSVQNQLDKFEQAGVLVSKLTGRTRLYSWNPKNSLTKRMRELVGTVYDAIPLRRREKLFPARHRHRSKGKPDY